MFKRLRHEIIGVLWDLADIESAQISEQRSTARDTFRGPIRGIRCGAEDRGNSACLGVFPELTRILNKNSVAHDEVNDQTYRFFESWDASLLPICTFIDAVSRDAKMLLDVAFLGEGGAIPTNDAEESRLALDLLDHLHVWKAMLEDIFCLWCIKLDRYPGCGPLKSYVQLGQVVIPARGSTWLQGTANRRQPHCKKQGSEVDIQYRCGELL